MRVCQVSMKNEGVSCFEVSESSSKFVSSELMEKRLRAGGLLGCGI